MSLEYAVYGIYTVYCGSSLYFPLIDGVLHTPPGFMLYGKDIFGYNVLIKANNGKIVYYERSKDSKGTIAWNEGNYQIIHEEYNIKSLYNNNSENYIRVINDCEVVTDDCSIEDSSIKDEGGWCWFCHDIHNGECRYYGGLNYYKCKKQNEKVNKARFVRCEPAPIPKYYYHAENVDEVVANYDKIIDIPEPDYSYAKYLMPSV